MLEVIPAEMDESINIAEQKLKVAAYVRVSTENDEQKSSFELQSNDFINRINANPNWEFVGVYADEGISGTELSHRKGMLQMIEDCRAGKINLILAKSIARFARNVVDCLSVIEELRNLNPPVGVYKAVRKEMHSGLRDPSVLIRGNSVTFNQAVLDSLESVSYVNVYFSEKLGKMAIKPVSGNTPHSMHWCVDGKNGKRKPRRVICPEMTKWFFEIMGWEQNIRYRVLGYLIEVDGEQVYVFDFNYARMFNERRKDEEGKLLPVDRKGHFSEDARRTMAMPVKSSSAPSQWKRRTGWLTPLC